MEAIDRWDIIVQDMSDTQDLNLYDTRRKGGLYVIELPSTIYHAIV